MITLRAKNGPVELSDMTIRALKQTYPTKDIDLELARLHLWLETHPERRPTRFWVFLKNCLRKAPDVLPQPMPAAAGWWLSESATLELGRSLGLEPRIGEEMRQYRERLAEQVKIMRSLPAH
jgi:hypothetical protein